MIIQYDTNIEIIQNKYIIKRCNRIFCGHKKEIQLALQIYSYIWWIFHINLSLSGFYILSILSLSYFGS